MISFAFALLTAPLAAPWSLQDGESTSGRVAIRAGTIHLVEGDRVVQNGTILVEDGRIVAVGTDLVLPPSARIVDYGPSAVIVPGFVAADSRLADGALPDRTANPDLVAVDGYDAYGTYASVLAGGVTSAYVTPARHRLVSGQAAVVKLAGDDPQARIVKAPVAVDGSIAAAARNLPGYWRMPLPATADIGIDTPTPQLPRTTAGAVLAYEELLEAATKGVELEVYGPRTVGQFAPLVRAKLPWRISAAEPHEIRALIGLAKEHGLNIVVEGAQGAADVAEELAAARMGVVFEVPFNPNQSGVDRGKGADAQWPDLTVASHLVEKGVRVAIDTPAGMALGDLRTAAVIARRGGMGADAALRAITLTPAEFYGVADRIGSLAPGKDADFVVLTGAPMEFGSTVAATWVEGELVYEAGVDTKDRERPDIVVVRAGEVHVGDGTVLAPGEVLVIDGRIVEVGARVARPGGVRIVDVPALMPGMIDAFGRLGLDGRRSTPDPAYDLTRLLEPGDETDVRVAKHGVTTVVLDSGGMTGAGAPLIAYRPASQELDAQVVDALAAIRLTWPDNDRRRSGRMVIDILEKAVKYRADWQEYRAKLAAWSPEAPRPEFKLPETKKDEPAAEGEGSSEGQAEGQAEGGDGEKKDDDKKKKKKDKELDPDPLTGIWVGDVVLAPATEEGAAARTSRLRLQLRLTDGAVEGYLRCTEVSSELVAVAGTYAADAGALVVTGLGTRGEFTLTGTLSDTSKEPEAAVTLAGRLVGAGLDVEAKAERTSREYPVAKRPTPAIPPEVTPAEEPRGKPKAPRFDANLEAYGRAIDGTLAVICEVERADEILACVEAFEAAGIAPVLLGASEAHTVADQLRGRVRGVLLSHQIVTGGATVDDTVNRYARLQTAGIPVAFYSAAEEGAVDLPLMAAYAVAKGMSPIAAVRALTSDTARMLAIDDRVGRIAVGLAADLVALTGAPLEPTTEVLRVWVAGQEVR
jgi:imidazolonepropionase-like amidohydrolase